MSKRVAIVLLNWNTRDYLKRFLPGIISTAGKRDEVIVADNGSTDGSQELVANDFPSVRLLAFERNYGFTGGYNRAFDLLRQDGFRYYLLLNTDIEVPYGWIEPLVEHMESNPDCGACGPKLHSYFERDKFEYAGAAGGLVDSLGFPFCRGRVLNTVERDSGQYDDAGELLWVSGAAFLTRSELYHRFGGLDNRFFAHMEEIDLCWRLQLAGYSVELEPKSTVYHIGGGTLPQKSPKKLFMNYRNNLLLLHKNLAKSIALDCFNKDFETIRKDREKALRYIEKLPSKACRKAFFTIFTRKVIDGAAALLYLLSGRFEYFKSVYKAHAEAKKLLENSDPKKETSDYLLEKVFEKALKGEKITVKGRDKGLVIFKKRL